MVRRRLGSLLLAIGVASTTAAGCGSEEGAPEGSATPPTSTGDPTAAPPGPTPEDIIRRELPWEVVSDQGETYLSNIFYADPSENEQIMPYALAGHVQIDRLVYPTLGNPNLYVKSDPADAFMTVLRIEEGAFAHLKPTRKAVSRSKLLQVTLEENATNAFVFLLVPRNASSRLASTESNAPVPAGAGTETLRITPTRILENPVEDDMPPALQTRKTLRFVFDQKAMKGVPPGLYDVRFELRREGKLFNLPNQTSGVYEYQFNALRVFDSTTEEYGIINVTDTQISVGDFFNNKTKDKLEEFAYYMNTTKDARVRNAAFITFNGDLHNGGSPGSLTHKTVATTYAEEAKVIVDTLKTLPHPIFLTAGNHDAFVSTGQVPGAVKTLDGDVLEQTIQAANPKAWPGYKWSDLKAFLASTDAAGLLGGRHLDIVTGGFMRGPGDTFSAAWREVPRQDRNMILYDGLYQWQKTYGPLTSSWIFGGNRYVNVNTSDLRQHRRSGWGMYTVNYGGGVSASQIAWVDRELARARTKREDVILLGHHDPRGGHGAKDLGFYFQQLDYRGIQQSAVNYLLGKVFNPIVCRLPSWAISDTQGQSCLHDGLQEWMRPDWELDCKWDERAANGKCDPKLFDPLLGDKSKRFYFSAFEMISRISQNPEVRTVLLGHTHWNSLEMMQAGDELVPSRLPDGSATVFASLEVQNPVRGFAFQGGGSEYDEKALSAGAVGKNNPEFWKTYEASAAASIIKLGGQARELAVLRLTSNADLTAQRHNGNTMLGFSALTLSKKADRRGYPRAQINAVAYFINSGSLKFDPVKEVPIDRNVRLGARDVDNPLRALFTGGL